MFIARIVIGFVVITTFVLLGAFLITRRKQYLRYLQQVLIYSGWLAVILILFTLIARVIRL